MGRQLRWPVSWTPGCGEWTAAPPLRPVPSRPALLPVPCRLSPALVPVSLPRHPAISPQPPPPASRLPGLLCFGLYSGPDDVSLMPVPQSRRGTSFLVLLPGVVWVRRMARGSCCSRPEDLALSLNHGRRAGPAAPAAPGDAGGSLEPGMLGSHTVSMAITALPGTLASAP